MTKRTGIVAALLVLLLAGAAAPAAAAALSATSLDAAALNIRELTEVDVAVGREFRRVPDKEADEDDDDDDDEDDDAV